MIRTMMLWAWVALFAGQIAHAEDSVLSKVVTVNIPEQKLTTALFALSEQAGIQMMSSPAAIGDGKTAGVRGKMTLQDALTQLLKGTKLQFRQAGPNTISIDTAEKDSARVLGPVRVEGQEQPAVPGATAPGARISERGHQSEEAIGYRARVASVAAGAPKALEDIPRAVSVLTQEQIEKQNITTFEEAMKRLPGITYENSGFQSGTVSARGYGISSYQVDGSPSRYFGLFDAALIDLSSYERVELVRGTNGVQIGQGSPGGSIALVRKRPGAEPSLRYSVTAGQWNEYRGEIDFSLPGVFGTPFGFRTVATVEDRKFFYDNASRNTRSLFAITDAPVGADGKVEFGLRYSRVDGNSSYDGVPRYIEGSVLEVPRSANFTPPWTFQDLKSTELFTRGYWDITPNWKLQGGASWNDDRAGETEYFLTPYLSKALGRTPDFFLTTASAFGKTQLRHEISRTFDLRLNGFFGLLGLNHAASLSGDYARQFGSGAPGTDLDNAPIRTLADLYALAHAPPTLMNAAIGEYRDTGFRYGFVFTDTISWRDHVDLTATARRNFTSVKSDTKLYEADTIVSPSSRKYKDEWRPTYSMTVKLPKHLRVFGALAEGSNDQSTNYSLSGALDPYTYTNREYGIRFALSDFIATLSKYDQRTQNVGVLMVPRRRGCGPLSDKICFYEGGASEKSTGIDFELTGTVLPGLDAMLSYNYNRNTTLNTPDPAPLSSQTPHRMGKVWLDWKPRWISDLSLQAGVVVNSRQYLKGLVNFIDPVTQEPVASSFEFEMEQPTYAVIDLGATYAWRKNVEIAGEVGNLTDRSYCSTVNTRTCFYGTPRNVRLTVRVKQF